MHVIDVGAPGAPISQYESVGATALRLADGAGEAHVYCIRMAPGGAIGRHPAGFGQLFVIVEGEGWVSGGDGRRVALRAGQGALIDRGEVHAKGTEHGMTALMIQVRDLVRAAPPGGA